MHFWATDDAVKLASALKAALAEPSVSYSPHETTAWMRDPVGGTRRLCSRRFGGVTAARPGLRTRPSRVGTASQDPARAYAPTWLLSCLDPWLASRAAAATGTV
jgi:hypothetical protein